MDQEKEILVEVESISKKFCRDLKRSMWYGLLDVAQSLFGLHREKTQLRKDEFWAVKGINFQLRRGECLGLIGRNGAGKSTLLKMLNGLIQPDEGSITMRGKIGALIELGAGFNPILSGRENIYVNGQILGFTKKEIDEKLQAIIDFSEIGEFIDAPVQNYSSGMKVRLGFSVAAQLEPDVLIIDEVLAVGDLGFVLKCFNTIDNLLEKTAVIFVSHSMPQVSRICTSIMMLEHGSPIYFDNDVSKGIDLYYSKFTSGKNNNNGIIFSRANEAELISVKFGEPGNYCIDDAYTINNLDDFHIELKLKIASEISDPYIILTINDKEQRPIGLSRKKSSLNEATILEKVNGFVYYGVHVVLPRINLSKGIYSISLSINENFKSKPLLRIQNIGSFQVLSTIDIYPPIEFETIWKPVVNL